MAFGPIMQFDLPRSSGVVVRLAPLSRDDMASFVQNGGMQSHLVIRYLQAGVQVLENEYEWYDGVRTNKNSICWGIYISNSSDEWRIIGTTSLSSITSGLMQRATSGILIFDPSAWGLGIATYAHRARTMYAFEQMGLVYIRSCYFDVNEASGKALRTVGYVQVGTERNAKIVDGCWRHQINLECINPYDPMWSMWWHDQDAPADFEAARMCTLEAIEWAKLHVAFL